MNVFATANGPDTRTYLTLTIGFAFWYDDIRCEFRRTYNLLFVCVVWGKQKGSFDKIWLWKVCLLVFCLYAPFVFFVGLAALFFLSCSLFWCSLFPLSLFLIPSWSVLVRVLPSRAFVFCSSVRSALPAVREVILKLRCMIYDIKLHKFYNIYIICAATPHLTQTESCNRPNIVVRGLWTCHGSTYADEAIEQNSDRLQLVHNHKKKHAYVLQTKQTSKLKFRMWCHPVINLGCCLNSREIVNFSVRDMIRSYKQSPTPGGRNASRQQKKHDSNTWSSRDSWEHSGREIAIVPVNISDSSSGQARFERINTFKIPWALTGIERPEEKSH